MRMTEFLLKKKLKETEIVLKKTKQIIHFLQKRASFFIDFDILIFLVKILSATINTY